MRNRTFFALILVLFAGKAIYVATEELAPKTERTVDNREELTRRPAVLPAVQKESQIQSPEALPIKPTARDWGLTLNELKAREFRDLAELTGTMNDLFNELVADRRLEFAQITEIRGQLKELEERKSARLPKLEVASYSVRLIDPTDPNRGLIVEPKMR